MLALNGTLVLQSPIAKVTSMCAQSSYECFDKEQTFPVTVLLWEDNLRNPELRQVKKHASMAGKPSQLAYLLGKF